MDKDDEALYAVGEALYRLSAAIIRTSGQPTRLSLTSASTLAALSRLGPQRITELAALQRVAQPSMTVVIRGLEQSGLVERAPDRTDGRAVLVSVTAAGEEYLAHRRQVGAEEVAAFARELSEEDAAALAAAVPALIRLRALQERSAQCNTASASKAERQG
jgi:DNA-binding MarR family transcriptional regulator